ncbi:MAG: coenzyme F420-0:L-glutamate ligase [Candidatus Hadarchaeales archaeon]
MPDLRIEIIGLDLPLVRSGDDLPLLIERAAERLGGIRDGDILVVSSKVVSISEGRLVDLSAVRPGKRAKELSRATRQPPEFVEVVLEEADEVVNAVRGALLTIKNGHLTANAGADLSNSPHGHAVLWPRDPMGSAERIMRSFGGRSIGVIIADSAVRPLRLGTVGQAIGWAGIAPVADCRGKPDLYGRPLRMTWRAIADQIATAAELVTGEGSERRPVVIVRGLEISERRGGPSPVIPRNRCLFFGKYARRGRGKRKHQR